MIKLGTLVRWLDKEGHFVSATHIYDLIKQASVEKFRYRIEQAAQGRETPFAEWFGEDERVYISLRLSEEQRADVIKEEYPYLLEIMQESGFNWTSADLARGSRGNITFNGKFARDKLMMNYLIDIWNDAKAKGLPILELLSSRKIIRDFWERMWKGTSVPRSDFETQLFNDIKEEQELEVDNWIFNAKESMEFVVAEIKQYFDSGVRSGTDRAKTMVISMRPDDIAGMSTDRRWTSCTNLDRDDGDTSNSASVYCEIARGGFAAYLIEPDDLDIDNPLARIWVRRFDSIAGKSFALPEETVYSDGRDFPEFLPALKAWIAEKQGDLSGGTYYLSGGEYSDTFEEEHEVETTAPLSPEIIADILMNPKIDEDGVQDIWKVKDEFYENWGGYFKEDADDQLTFSHLTNPKIFGSKEAAEKWIREHNDNAWRDEIIQSVLLYDEELRYETNDIYDDDYDEDNLKEDNHNIMELEGYSLTDEGLELAAWGKWDSQFKRWSITHTTKSALIQSKKRGVQARGLTWMITQLRRETPLVTWMEERPKETKDLKNYIQSDMSHAPELRYSKQEAVRAIYKRFPSLFPEDRKKYSRDTGMYLYSDELAVLLKYLEEGEEKEAFMQEAEDMLKDAYDSKIAEAYTGYSRYYHHDKNLGFYVELAKEVSRVSPAAGERIENNLVNLYQNSFDAVNQKNKFSDDILRSLHAVSADGSATVDLYEKMLQSVIDDDLSPVSFKMMQSNLMQVGRSGEKLMPLLATIYKDLRSKTKTEVGRPSTWSIDHNQRIMNEIYKVIKSIREDAPNKSKRESDFSALELQDELELIM
jgi:hypothetical protein